MSWQYDFCEAVGGELGVKLMENAMVGVVKELIDAGYDINELQDYGVPAWAILLTDREVPPSFISFIFEQGAIIPKEDLESPSLLNYALKKGLDSKTIKILIEHGADPSFYGEDRETSLHWACYNDEYPLEIFKLLVERGAPLNILNVFEDATPLANACLAGLDIEIIRYLIEVGSDVNTIDANGDTPLMHLSIRNSNILKRVKLLVQHGAKLDIVNYGGSTVMGIVVDSILGEGAVVEYLIEQGVDPNIVENGRTYLMMGLAQEKWEIAEALIKGGFTNFDYIDEIGESIFDQLDEEGVEQLKYLIDKYTTK